MPSGAEIAELFQASYDHAAIKLFEVGLTALLVYDYFLTLNDEIHYAWKLENVPVFVLFLSVRYLPIVFRVWLLIMSFDPGYTPETAFISLVYFTLITVLSQVVLALRAYATTMKNKWVAGILFVISAADLSFGSYISIRAAVDPLPALPVIPLPIFQGCYPNIQASFMVIQMVLPLVFDVAIFVLLFVQVKLIKSRYQGVNKPIILDRINRDAEIYFAVITTSHLLAVVMYFTIPKRMIEGLPVLGNMVLMPIMICRMIISLKKAADSTQPHMSLEVPIASRIGNMRESHLHPEDNIQLSVFRR